MGLLKGALIFLLGNIILVPIIIVGIQYYLSRPPRAGTIHLPYLEEEVEIQYDKMGIPYISAPSLKSVYFGLGFAHGADRLWEMAFKRHVMSGRLSEIAGERTIEIDKFIRTLSVRHAAERSVKHLKQELKQIIEAYCEGVNSFASQQKMLSSEFYIVGLEFEPWTPVDVFMVGKFMSFHLSMNWFFQLVRTEMADVLGEEIGEMIYPMRDKDNYGMDLGTVFTDEDLKEMNQYSEIPKSFTAHPPVLPPEIALNKSGYLIESKSPKSEKTILDDKFREKLYALFHSQPEKSNAWAISGEHTKSGFPLLSSDPHLNTRMPSAWHLSYLELKSRNGTIIARGKGANMAGAPGIMIGRNEHFGWGCTALMGEDTEIFQMVIDKEEKHYYYNKSWVPLHSRIENIQVKGRNENITYDIKSSHHGPILFNVPPEAGMLMAFASPSACKNIYALSTPFSQAHDQILEAVIYNLVSNDVGGLERFLHYNMSVNLGLVWATDKDIGLSKKGVFRKGGNPQGRMYVLEGWNPKHDWKEFSKVHERSNIQNPKKGFIAIANNRHSSSHSKTGEGTTITTTARGQRANQLLSEGIKKGHKFEIEDFVNMQKDTVDLYAKMIFPLMIKLAEKYKDEYLITYPSEKENINSVIEQVKEWKDYNISETTTPGLFAIVWEIELLKNLFNEQFELSDSLSYTSLYAFDHFFIRLLHDWDKAQQLDHVICSNSLSRKFKFPCIFDLLNAANNAKIYILHKLGNDKSNWKWGQLHQFVFPHHPFTTSLLGKLYDRKMPAAGNKRTLYASVFRTKAMNYNAVHIPNLRMITSLDDFDNTYFSLDTGVSGDMFDKHYDDFMLKHKHVELVKMVKPTDDGTHEKLILKPQPKGNKE